MLFAEIIVVGICDVLLKSSACICGIRCCQSVCVVCVCDGCQMDLLLEIISARFNH